VPPFVDTNVLIYAVDEEEPRKLAVAEQLVEEHLVQGEGMISVQVLREFYNASRRLKSAVSDERAMEMVTYFSTFNTLSEDFVMVLQAIRLSQEYMLSFWDALIVESALKGGADRLFTEDLQHGQVIEGLRIENPFL
jgi:predicted nucleic acid-binding protein